MLILIKKIMNTNVVYQYFSMDIIQVAGLLAFLFIFFGSFSILLLFYVNYTGDKTLLSSLIAFTLLFILFVIWIWGRKFVFEKDNYFLTSDDYFEKFENNLTDHINSDNFKTYLADYKRFISSDKKILCIHSFAGNGKSHLLRLISEYNDKLDNEINILFAQPNFPYIPLEKALNDEIQKNKSYLLIFDISDFTDVKKIVSLTGINNSIKIIFSVRTCDLKFLLKKIDVKYDEINIKWSNNNLIQFLREITNNSTINDLGLVTYYNNPRLIKLKFDAVNNPNFNTETFEMILNDLEKDSKSCLSDFNHPFVEKERLMITLACLVPFSKKDKKVFDILERQTRFEINEIKEMIENLINGGIFLEIDDSISFNSDIMGYIYLHHKLKYHEDTISLIENLINLKMEIWDYFPKNIYLNLGNAIFINNILLQTNSSVDIPEVYDLFSKIVNEWIDKEDKTFGAIRAENLSYLEFFAQIVPDRTLDLLNTYIDSNPPINTDSYLNQDLKMDDFSPVLIKLFETPSIEKDILDFIEKMQEKGLKSTYRNYESCDLIKQFISLFGKLNNNQILNSLNIFDGYLNNLTNTRIQLISCALTEIFSVSKYDHLVSPFEIKRIKLELTDTPETRNIRNLALKILKGLINHDHIDAKFAGIEIAEKLGSKVSKEDDKLSDLLTEERKELVVEIGDLIKKGVDFKLLTKIEDLFLRWWATKAEGTNDVEKYLDNATFPRDMEYVVSKHFSEKYVIENFDEFIQHSPDEDLWKWFVEQEHKYLLNYYEPNYYKDIVRDLDKEYDDINGLVAFLKIIDKNITDFSFNYNIPLIACWIQKKPDLFLKIKNDGDIWVDVPERFKGGIELALSEVNKDHLYEMAEDLLKKLKDVNPPKLNSFLIAIGKNSIETSQVKTWLNKIIEDGSNNQRILVMSRLMFIFEDDVDSIAEIFYKIISKEPKLNSRIINESWLIMTSLNENIDKINPDTQKDLRKDLFEKLIKVKDLNDEFDEIIDFVFTNMDECFDFIEKRINHFINNRGISYNPIPYDGIGYIKNNINSYDEFEGFMDKFSILYNDNLDWHIFLDDLMSDIKHIPIDEDESYLQKYIEKQIQELNIDSAILSLKFLSLSIKNYKIFLQLCELGISSGKYDDIKIILLNNSENDKIIKKMHDESGPGKLRGLLNSLISN